MTRWTTARNRFPLFRQANARLALLALHSRFFHLASRFAQARRGLAARTKMAATPRNNHAANLCAAANTRLSFPLVNTVAELEFAPVPVGVHIIRNGRAAQTT